MPKYTQSDIDAYLAKMGATQGSDWQYLQPLMGDIYNLGSQGKFYDLAEIRNLPQGQNLDFYKTRQTQADINLESMMKNLDWAYKTWGSLGGTGNISKDFIMQNMGLKDVQGLDQADINYIVNSLLGAYGQKFLGQTPTPTPLGPVSNQPSSGSPIGVTTGGVQLYGSNPLQTEVASRAAGGTQRTLIDIINSRPDILNMLAQAFPGQDPFQQGTAANTWINDWWNREGPKEYPGVSLIQPATPTAAQGAGTSAGGISGLTGGVAGGDAKDTIIQQLTDALQKSVPTGTLESAYKSARETAGIGTLEGQIGTFEQEIQRTQSLLTDLENQVKSGQAFEEGRLAPMNIIRGRQEAIAGAVEPTRQDLLKTLGLAQTSRSQLLDTLQRKNQDILAQLGLKEKDLENLKMNSQIIGTQESGYYQILTDKDGNVVKTTELIKGTGAEKWSEPYQLGGDWVQKNEKTGEVRVAVNVPAPTQPTVSERTAAAKQQHITDSSNKLLASKKVKGGQYVDGNEYMELRRSYPGDPSEFDEKLSYLLSPGDLEQWQLGRWKPTSGDSNILTVDNIEQWQLDLGIKPGMTKEQANQILAQNQTIVDIMIQTKSIFQQYKNANWARKDVERKWAQENGHITSDGTYSLPKAIKSLLDEVYKK